MAPAALFALFATALAAAAAAAVEPPTQPVIGIDFGTTYSSVAVWHDGRVELLADELGSQAAPAATAWGTRTPLLGHEALASLQAPGADASAVVHHVKRLLGMDYSDPLVAALQAEVEFNIVEGRDGRAAIVLPGPPAKVVSPEQVAAVELRRLKRLAQEHLQQEVVDAVVTVPAHFANRQRLAVLAAGKIAGLNVRRLLNAPTAAALALNLDQQNQTWRHAVVVNVGGGAFDATIFGSSDRSSEFHAFTTKGDTHLGGTDFDARLCKLASARFEARGVPPEQLKAPAVAARLRASCEAAKRQLSFSFTAPVELQHAGQTLRIRVTRSEFEAANEDLFAAVVAAVGEALEDAGLEAGEVDALFLTGGSARVPKLQELLGEALGRPPAVPRRPDSTAAVGAALKGAALQREAAELRLQEALKKQAEERRRSEGPNDTVWQISY